MSSRPQTFNAFAKTLHWIMAIGISIAWLAVEYRHSFTTSGSAESALALDIHMLAGWCIALLILPRLVWRFTQIPPPPVGSKAERAIAKVSHWSLYGLMLVMPATGYLGTGRDTRVFDWFTIPQFQNTPAFEWLVTSRLAMSFEDWEKPVDFLHKDIGGTWALPCLFLLHAGAALFHHFVKRDDVLLRMLPGKQT
jgi:cytochrome b561